MKPFYYKLDGKLVVPCDQVGEWARWFETAHRAVRQENVGPFFVSTVFLGLDHRFEGDGPPLVFESAVFTEGEAEILGKVRKTLTDSYMERTTTWELALEAHERAVAWARARRPMHKGAGECLRLSSFSRRWRR